MKKVEHKKKKKIYVVVYLLVMCALLLGGMTLLGVVFQESWQLFLKDVGSGFLDACTYRNCLILFLMCLVPAGIYLWNSLFGNVCQQWNIRLWKKQFCYQSGDVWKRHPVFSALLALLVSGGAVYAGYCDYEKAKITDTWETTATVGHSFGQLEDATYTGSLEAFQKYYALGQRTFEVDLAVTKDDKPVLKHDWDFPAQEGIDSEHLPTEEEFLKAPVWGKYTPLSFADLCVLMKEHQDIWIVTDTKSEEPEQVKQEFELLVKTAQENNCEEILDRLVIQVYSERMYECLRENFNFRNYIYTFYQKWNGTPEEMVEICRYCVNNGIGVVAFQNSYYKEEMQEIADRYGLKIYLHTVNDIEEAKQYLRMGVFGVYTDTIVPAQLED